MQEADRLCDRVAIIDHGRFVAMDTPGNLKSQVSANGEDVTLEEVFFALTGKNLKEDVYKRQEFHLSGDYLDD